AANITEDREPYIDASIVREGPVGDQGDGAYSTGRGGAANIGSPNQKPTTHGIPHDQDIVPETATRMEEVESHHVGRGGEGNVHHHHQKEDKPTGEGTHKESLVDKIKDKIGMGKKE
ncbi:hypothetical protein MMC25_000065, partial [Agyrium rufum]|nr:hypothetical protein [Agyrium rufum]